MLTPMFKNCRLLLSNVWKNKELTIVQRRILGKLRRKNRMNKMRTYSKENSNSFIQLQTKRKLSLFYGASMNALNNPKTNRPGIASLLSFETRLDVTLVRLHFCQTLGQARQLISHRKIKVETIPKFV